jgi:hypothetical protein
VLLLVQEGEMGVDGRQVPVLMERLAFGESGVGSGSLGDEPIEDVGLDLETSVRVRAGHGHAIRRGAGPVGESALRLR